MTRYRFALALTLPILASACETSALQLSSSQARQGMFRCSGDVTLDVRRSGSTVMVSDSRGIQATLPASPAGQNARYAEGIYALILEEGSATWFVSGQVPAECRR